MNRKEFEIWTRNHIRLMDGATGSNLMKAGMPRGVCTESWVLSHPNALLSLQRAYQAAGSDMVYAPTFCANRIALASSSLEGEVCRMNRELVALSKQAVGSGILVAGDMTTTGRPADPEDSAAYQLLFDAYREQAEALIAAGVDLIGVETMMGEMCIRDRNFAVRQHLKYVELYANPDNYNALTYEDTLLLGQELAPLITPEEDAAKALRFDALIYGIELAYLVGKKYGKARSDLFKKVSAVASVANIPEIMAQAELIDKILHTDYVENAGINEFEHIREDVYKRQA